jgi:outer membrane protein OmpA-like peptidoglycan-associated protein
VLVRRTGSVTTKICVLAALIVGGGAGFPGPAAAAGEPVTVGSVQVPVLGQVTGLALTDGTADRYGVFTVHGVRRVNGATVLYFSLGIPAGSAGASQGAFNPSTATDPGEAEFLFDTRARLGYSVVEQGGAVVASKRSYTDLQVGQAIVKYTVFPALPADTTEVDVMVGRHQIVPHIPVEDGPLLPAVGEPDGSEIPLGTGWPAIDPAAGQGVDAAASTFPLESLSEALDKSATVRRKAKATTVDLSADVLFAVDSATLSPRAEKLVARLAQSLKKEATPGAKVTIVGHTDSTGSPSHNRDLSKRRAQSVEKALKTELGGASFDFAVTGRGESDPVATNATAEGRKANRRVSVSYVERQS